MTAPHPLYRRASRLARRCCGWPSARSWCFPAGVGAEEPILPIPKQVDVDPCQGGAGAETCSATPSCRRTARSPARAATILASGGDDGRKVSVGIDEKPGMVNAPTVFNVAMNFKQFWDGRANTLEDQIDGPVQSPFEMGSVWPEVVAKLYRERQVPHAIPAALPRRDQAQEHKERDRRVHETP